MDNSDRLKSYLDILKVRQKARRRDATIMGVIFFIAFISMIALGLLSGLGSREVYLVAALNVVFGMIFLMAWVRHEIITGIIDLLNNFQIRE